MQGVIAAIPTPLTAEGRPDRDLFLEHGTWALANGCDGLNVLGSTGEASSFDGKTREQVMGWAAESFGAERLMVGTATPSLAETVRLTTVADELGYQVALVLPPYYYKPVSDDGLFNWYAQLHKALGSRSIAIYFYNYPQMTGLTIPPAVMERLHKSWPERFRGIKDSSGKLEYCRDLVARIAGFKVFPSAETALGEAHAAGFAGCISATANLTAPLCASAWAATAGADPSVIQQMATLRAAIAAQPLIAAVKYLIGRRTGVAGWERPLPPFLPLDADAKAALAPVLSELADVWAALAVDA